MWDRTITCLPSTQTYWELQSRFSDTTLQNFVGTGGVSKCTILWSRTTPAGTREDFVSTNLHMCVHVGAGSYVALTDSQKADAEADLDTFTTAIAARQSNQFTLAYYQWHDIIVGDATYGQIDRSTTKSTAGGSASMRLPDQLSVNATFRTAARRHWGRIYLPGIGSNHYETTYGRVTNAGCDGVASDVRTLANNLVANTAATELVIFSKAHGAVLSVDEIHVDNVPDVVRRRRAKMASYRKIYTS